MLFEFLGIKHRTWEPFPRHKGTIETDGYKKVVASLNYSNVRERERGIRLNPLLLYLKI